MDIAAYNRAAWNREADSGSPWSTPVSSTVIDAARRGDWHVVLTPTRAVPREWFGNVSGTDLLCLASGGGQQAPVLAAAGARVTSFDLSDAQLRKDHEVAVREGLTLRCVQGDMRDLSAFADASFDLVFNATSIVFVPDPAMVWRECHRVLKPGGVLLAGFMNPAYYLFDHEAPAAQDKLTVVNRLPCALPGALAPAARAAWEQRGWAAEFGHTLDALLGAQLAAGFVITALYEDAWSNDATALNAYMPMSFATRAEKRA